MPGWVRTSKPGKMRICEGKAVVWYQPGVSRVQGLDYRPSSPMKKMSSVRYS